MHNLFPLSNEDVGITVLSHLPQKSLLRFRSVSKSWRDTIDSSCFRELHIQNQVYNNNSRRKDDDDRAFLRLILLSRRTWTLSMKLVDAAKSFHDFPSYRDFFRNHVGSGILGFSGPVHGLICLYENVSCNPIALCNPSLGKIKILPPNTSSVSFYGLDNVGFGYDDLKQDYKVVQMWFNHSQKRTVVEVYSRRENTWRVLAENPLPRDLLIAKPIRRLRPWINPGVVHWYGWKCSTEWLRQARYCSIISFDMRSEALEMIDIPFTLNSSSIDVAAKKDSILLFASFSVLPFEIGGVDIWEYKREWIKIVRHMPIDEVTSWMSDGLVFKIVSDCKLFVYEYCSKRVIKGIDLDVPFISRNYEREIEYIGSFISP